MKTATQPTMASLSPSEAQERLSQADVLLLDVRTILEFSGSQVPGSLNLPLDALSSDSLKKRLGGKEPIEILILCQSGKRAGKAAVILARDPAWKVHVVEGGLQQWREEGLPIDQKAAVISLERQVRIAAGALVLVGLALGQWVHPWGIALSGFVGAGLVFAGWTDTCGMGMLLAKAPWNRRACTTA